MAHRTDLIDGALAFSVERLAAVTGNPMHDVGYQCSDTRPYFKFVSGSAACYTTLHPKHATTAKTVSVYTKGAQREGYDTMRYVGTGSQTGSTLTYGGGAYTNSGYANERIRTFAVNRWAKYKPFRNSAISFASQSACDTARANAFQGFDAATLCIEMTPGSDGRFPHLIYEYLPPRKDSSDESRMLDFACIEGSGKGYYHGAKPPMVFRFVDQPFRKDWVYFVTFMANPTGESGYDMYNCLSIDDLFNNSAANGAYGYCPSLLVQDLSTKEFIVISSGVTLSSINKTNGTAMVPFCPEDMPFFTTINRVGHDFEIIACLTTLDATNGTKLQGSDYGPVYYGQEHVLYGARSLEFEEGVSRRTVTLEDRPPKNYDGVSLSVATFSATKKSGTSIMGSSWTDFYINSNIVINWATDDRYDNTNFPVKIYFTSSTSGIPLINGGQAQGGLYKTVTVPASNKNSSGTTTIYASELLNVILSAPTTIGSFTLIVKAVIDNPDSEIGQTQITAQNTYTFNL